MREVGKEFVVGGLLRLSWRRASARHLMLRGCPGDTYTHTHTWLSLSSSSSFIIIFKSFSLDAILDVVRRHLVRCELLDILEFIQI
jgi:hypothetical protein